MGWQAICSSAEASVECAQGARRIGLAIEPNPSADPLGEARRALQHHTHVALVLAEAPSLAEIVELAHAARQGSARAAMAIVAGGEERRAASEVSRELGIVCVGEVRPLLSAVRLMQAGAEAPWSASLRALAAIDRARLRTRLGSPARVRGQLVPDDGGLVAWTADRRSPALALGEARDVAEALVAMRDTEHDAPELVSSVEGISRQTVLDVIFGPARALSDPASKAALAPYGVPLPAEELCSSASRTAAEASRLGFPVRVSLTSPDLRLWDHPDLVVDWVDNSARAREVFGHLHRLARDRQPDARILGVTVGAASEASALLSMRAFALPHGRVGMELGFADPHGRASGDRTHTVLPCRVAAIERAVGRLNGRDLILAGSSARRREHVEAIADLMLRLAAFINNWREEVAEVELRPVALLLSGGTEARDACVVVGDKFERELATG